MPVRLRPERQILEDIVKYKKIAQKLDDVGDIPQRRTKPSTSKKSPAKNKRKAGASKAKKKTAASKTKKKTHVSKTEKIKPPSKRAALEELKERIFRQKPSFMGKAPVPFSKAPVAALKASASKPLENESRFPSVGPLHTQAKTFEQQVLVRTSYDEKVNAVRQHSDHIDFGMSWRILPKNIEKESQRFSFEFEADKVMAQQSGSLLSGDIDYYFWQLGQTFLETNARNVPLI